MKRGVVAGLAALSVIVVALTSAGCAPSEYITPPTGPGTPYPCGYTGVWCFPVDGTHTCCWQHSSCRQDDDGPYCHTEQYDPSDPINLGAPRRKLRFAEKR